MPTPLRRSALAAALALAIPTVAGSATTKPNAAAPLLTPPSSLAGSWVSDAWAQAILATRSPLRAASWASPTALVVERDGERVQLEVTSWHESVSWILDGVAPESAANEIVLRLADDGSGGPPRELAAVLDGPPAAARTLRTSPWGDDQPPLTVRRLDGDVARWVARAVLAGRYRDDRGATWTFGEDGTATWPARFAPRRPRGATNDTAAVASFPYEIALDTAESDCDSLQTPDPLAPDGPWLRYGFRWLPDGRLAIHAIDYDRADGPPIACSPEPLAVLIPVDGGARAVPPALVAQGTDCADPLAGPGRSSASGARTDDPDASAATAAARAVGAAANRCLASSAGPADLLAWLEPRARLAAGPGDEPTALANLLEPPGLGLVAVVELPLPRRAGALRAWTALVAWHERSAWTVAALPPVPAGEGAPRIDAAVLDAEPVATFVREWAHDASGSAPGRVGIAVDRVGADGAVAPVLATEVAGACGYLHSFDVLADGHLVAEALPGEDDCKGAPGHLWTLVGDRLVEGSCPLAALPAPRARPGEPTRFTHGGPGWTLEHRRAEGKPHPDAFTDGPITLVRRDGTRCELDAGNYAATLWASDDGSTLADVSFSGASAELELWDTATCRVRDRLNVSGSAPVVDGDTVRFDGACELAEIEGVERGSCLPASVWRLDGACRPVRLRRESARRTTDRFGVFFDRPSEIDRPSSPDARVLGPARWERSTELP